MICSRSRRASIFALLFTLLTLLAAPALKAQQTLGAITGVVTDPSGSILPGATVTLVGEQTGLKRTAVAGSDGFYNFQNLPIGTYTLTFARDGFETDKFPGIAVQADRTVTLPAQLKVGAATDSVTVEATPLLNAVDTTNGYILDKSQIESIPLPTGSFTGTAILSPGVNAELPGGTGVNSGLGNAPIWANGERDTSNSFLLNGVDGSNLFNGKSTSQVASARVVNSTGTGNAGAGGVVQSSASVYLSIGNGIPTPAPETIEEIRVNASMYDAQQGSTSGAHIDLSTASGTNGYHGTAYIHRGTDWINAAPFFFKQDPDIPANMKVPQLHRYALGGAFGGPIVKDKLFGYLAYQHTHVSDQEIGDSFLDVPVGLSDTNRSANGLAYVANYSFCSATDIANQIANGETPCTPITGAQVNNVAQALFNLPAAPGQPGKWLIPNDSGAMPTYTHPDNAFIPGTAFFIADQAVADLDYNASAKDTVALKYYYQHDPTHAPYAYSNVPEFTQQLDAGSQVFSINNTYLLKSNLSTTQTVGILREKVFSNNAQPFTAANIPGCLGCVQAFGSSYFPGFSIVNTLGDYQPTGLSPQTLAIGPNATAQGSNTGVFQNRIMPSGNAIWTLGKHSVGFGGSWAYTQLNVRDNRTGAGNVASSDFNQFTQGNVTPNYDYYTTTFLQGNANRYYRANQVGLFLQDKFQITPTITLTAGIRYDWDGGLTEKNGDIYNFDASKYSYTTSTAQVPTDTTPGTLGPDQSGFIIAGNNANGTPGVSKTTLSGRQWGFGPRLGAAWSPKDAGGKLVVRAGTGIYYDRGELYTYFSPGYAIGDVTGGPFGVSQQLPFVNAQTCVPIPYSYPSACGNASLNDPWGPTLQAAPNNPKASDLSNYLPNATAIVDGAQPVSLGVYDTKNKLPYSINYTLDLQWQPRHDLALELGYVGNVGRHQVIPVPFNQPIAATPGNPIHGESYSYGYTVQTPAGCQAYVTCTGSLPIPANGSNPGSILGSENGMTTQQEQFEGGNIDLRVPYIGYAAESIDYKAAGVSAYNALQLHVEKRMSHGLQVGASYTYSHALDEQSGLGLFYNGNNPLNLRDGYASSDFDRTHVLNFTYVYKFPSLHPDSQLIQKFTNGWEITGLTVLQSGQPYSVIDYSGAVGSLYYSVYDGITNPIVPLAPGCTPKSAKAPGNQILGTPSLNASCFTLPLIGAGDPLAAGIVPGDTFESKFTTGQRNIFRQTPQRRADASLVKETQISDRYALKYSFDVYNLTNTASFDIPTDNVTQNGGYSQTPIAGETPLPTGCNATGQQTNSSFYNCASGLGITTRTIGSPRQIQMSLHLKF
jgi:hypothetical protein